MSAAQLMIKLALRELVDNYALAIDKRDAACLGRLFTAQGKLEIYEPDVERSVAVYTGTPEIESIIGLLTPYVATFHVMANHLVTVESDRRASGIVYCHAHHLNDNQTANTVMLIRYQDDYLLDHGVWRFARRQVMRQWNNSLIADRSPLAL